MAAANPDPSIDPKSGFCSRTRIYHSLRPEVPLPPPSQPLSITQYAFSLLHSSISASELSSVTCVADAITGESLTYRELLDQVRSLSVALKTRYSLSKDDVAYIICPVSLRVPVLYLSLLSIGVVVSPANPVGSSSEVSRQIKLSRSSVAFATSDTCHKLPSNLRTVLIDSSDFLALLTQNQTGDAELANINVTASQEDSAAILYSSGTTGKFKGVVLTHRNLIAVTGGYYHLRYVDDESQEMPHPVALFPLPLFHVFGFTMLLRAIAMGDTIVLMERFNFETMLKTVEKYKVTFMPVSPPVIVGFIKSELTQKYDISSLLVVGCGGAPLGKEVADKFKEKFPHVQITQGYAMTETSGSASRTVGPEESKRYGSAGRIAELSEAKIVDPETGEALPPGQRGELWLRGPSIMKEYLGDNKATAETFDSEGWLKTGDLCYFDSDGFLYIVDRLKELIKYKAYQVPPAELEHLLQSHPEIADSAVIPYPDEFAGQIPMAFVVRKPGSNITEADVMDFIAKQVAPYKKIRRVAFINAIPKNPSGKILRRELTSLATSGNLSKL